MKQSTFCVASSIREEGALAKVMASAQKRLRQANISFTEPKLGKHITFAPPFKAVELEMHWLIAGLECAHTFHCSNGVPKMAKGGGLDFFIGEKTDALIVQVIAGEKIKDFAERFRSNIPKHTKWVYPPETYLVNFHATIGEGEDLRKAINDHGGIKEIFKGLNFQQPIQLEPPKVFQKEDGLWRPCRM